MFTLVAKGLSYIWNSVVLTSTKGEIDSQTKNNIEIEDEEKKIPIKDFKDIHPELNANEKNFYGKVTGVHNGYGLIDEHVYFDFDVVCGGFRPPIGTKVSVRAICKEDGGWIATKVSTFEDWDDSEEETSFEIDLETCKDATVSNMIGSVTYINNTQATVNNELSVDFKDCEDNFVPVCGDWVKVTLLKSKEGNKQQVKRVEPVKSKKIEGRITELKTEFGVIDKEIYFNYNIVSDISRLKCGDTITAVVIESTYLNYCWRATYVVPMSSVKNRNSRNVSTSNVPLELLLKDKNGINITGSLDFGVMQLGKNSTITIKISNDKENQTLLNYQLISSANNQFTVRPVDPDLFNDPVVLESCHNVDFVAECKPSIFGKSSQILIFNFEGFTIGRVLSVYVQDPNQKLMLANNVRNTAFCRKQPQELPLSLTLADAVWVVPGQRPKLTNRNFGQLLQYRIPSELWDCVMNKRNLLKLEPNLAEPLNERNYKIKFQTLLHIEEIQLELEMQQFAMREVTLELSDGYLALEVPGLADGRPSLIIGDTVVVVYANVEKSKGPNFEGCIHEISNCFIHLMFHPTFHKKYSQDLVNVYFKLNRTTLRRSHQAVQWSDMLGSQVLFPKEIKLKMPFVNFYEPKPMCEHKLAKAKNTTKKKRQTVVDRLFNSPPKISNKSSLPPSPASPASSTASDTDSKNFNFDNVQDSADQKCNCDKTCNNANSGACLNWFNPVLNNRQKASIRRILRGIARPTPYIIFGPPGTGKTMTVVEAVLQIYHMCKNSRILVSAPSNSAADLLTERLHLSGKVECGTMVRINAFMRKDSNIPDSIREYCTVCDNLEIMARYRLIVCTCATAGLLHTLKLPADHFTHVFVDEAGQATEPECLIPMLFAGNSGQIVLAGDPQQLGPVLKSNTVISCGFGISFLERLMRRPLYLRDAEKYSVDSYNPLLVTKLINNYRSHPRLLELPSKLFYHNELLALADLTVIEKFADSPILPKKNFPIVFHGIDGENLQEENNPSWFNAVEVMQVMRYLGCLYQTGISADDIGIVTPYRKQVEKIRLMLDSLEMEKPKVGSTEEFQGQERLVMIISTVRSCDQTELSDNALGFLGNKKRFNVSITRAKALLIIIGNPFVLAEDSSWREMLDFCIKNGSYIGCDLPILENIKSNPS